MHSIVKARPGPGAEYEMWPKPKPGLRDVLVEVEANSICGTDMHIYDWHESIRDKVKPPIVMGHEFAGKVLEAGKEVSDLREGDIVSGETHIFGGGNIGQEGRGVRLRPHWDVPYWTLQVLRRH